MKKQSNLFKRMTLAAAVATTLLSSTAFAASTTAAPVTVVEYQNFPQLLVQLSGTANYYANTGSSPGCSIPAPSAETVKIWASLAQAALLSGKNVKIYFTPCNGFNYITTLDLNQ